MNCGTLILCSLAGIFIYYLIKRHRYPQLYGKSRYLNQDAVVNGQTGNMAAGKKVWVTLVLACMVLFDGQGQQPAAYTYEYM